MNLGNVALKSAHVRKILLTAEGCEDKLEKIHTLVGLPYEKSTGNDVPALDATQDGEASLGEELTVPIKSERDISVEKILEDLSGNPLKHAKYILGEIEKSLKISWNYTTLEITINNKLIPHSNIKVLIEKIVQVEDSTLPTALALFIYNLIEIKCSINVFKSADSLNIRENLLDIRKNVNSAPLGTENDEQGILQNQEIRDETLDVQNSGLPIETQPAAEAPLNEEKESRKRKRSETEEQDTDEPRRSSPRLALKRNLQLNWQQDE